MVPHLITHDVLRIRRTRDNIDAARSASKHGKRLVASASASLQMQRRFTARSSIPLTVSRLCAHVYFYSNRDRHAFRGISLSDTRRPYLIKLIEQSQ